MTDDGNARRRGQPAFSEWVSLIFLISRWKHGSFAGQKCLEAAACPSTVLMTLILGSVQKWEAAFFWFDGRAPPKHDSCEGGFRLLLRLVWALGCKLLSPSWQPVLILGHCFLYYYYQHCDLPDTSHPRLAALRASFSTHPSFCCSLAAPQR